MKEVIFKQSLIKQIKLVLLGILMISASALITFAETKYGLLTKIFGIIGLVFFSICFLFIIKRLIKPIDLLIINEKGFTENSSSISVGFISWEDVKEISIKSMYNVTFISVDVNNKDKQLAKLTVFKKIMVKLNMALGYPPININIQSIKANPTDIINIMKEYHKAFKDKEQLI